MTSSFTFATTNSAAIDREFYTSGRFNELHLKTFSSKKRSFDPSETCFITKTLTYCSWSYEIKRWSQN